LSTAKNGQRPPSKLKAEGMNDCQLMAALGGAEPEKYGDAQAGTGPRRNGDDREIDEILSRAESTIPELPAEAHEKTNKILRAAAGVGNTNLALRLLSEATGLPFFVKGTEEQRFLTVLAFMQELQPETVTQSLLAVQMFGVHNTALLFLNRANIEGQTVEGAESCIRRAINLMRLFGEQLEAMAKLKGKIGQQKVTVEHVHVHEGGQAIVGAVVTPKPSNGGGGQ